MIQPHHKKQKDRASISLEFSDAIRRLRIKEAARIAEMNAQTLEYYVTGQTRASMKDARLFVIAERLGFPKERVFE